jgi:hypothetical protein
MLSTATDVYHALKYLARCFVWWVIDVFVIVLDIARRADLRGELGIEVWLSILSLAQYTLGRDKLFALYNLSSLEDRQSIRIDYERSDRDVFKEAAAYLIKKCGFDALHTGNVNKSSNFSLPSWAPDWSFQDPPRSTFILSDVRPYKACETNASWERLGISDWKLNNESSPAGSLVQFSPDLEMTAVRGLEFDVISLADSSLLESVPHSRLVDAVKNSIHIDLRRDVVEFFRLAEEKVMTYPNDPYEASCGRCEAFWRTIIGDRSRFGDLPDSSSVGRFETIMGRRNESQSEHWEYVYGESYFSKAFASCYKRVFIISSKGYIGLGPPGTQVGDMICVLRGGRAPFVLRQGRYPFGRIMIGDAYIHGIIREYWIQ